MSVYGTLLSREQVTQAALSTLQTPPSGTAYPLLVYYLAEVERQLGLTARTLPTPGGYRAGLDFMTWKGDDLPLLIGNCQPFGAPERYGEGTYAQWYEIQVATVVEDPNGDETVAARLADRYGIAVAGALCQHGGLGTPPFAEKTVLAGAPKTEFLDGAGPDARRFAQSVVTVHTLIEQIVQEDGPTSYPADPYAAPAAAPTITLVDLTLLSQTPAGVTDTAEGVTVTDPNANVRVHE